MWDKYHLEIDVHDIIPALFIHFEQESISSDSSRVANDGRDSVEDIPDFC